MDIKLRTQCVRTTRRISMRHHLPDRNDYGHFSMSIVLENAEEIGEI